jgi:flagellar biosynthesis protein FliR
MHNEGGWSAGVSRPLVRLGAWIVVVVAFGSAGVNAGIRAVGAMLLVFALMQVIRRSAGNASSWEPSGRPSAAPVLLLAAVQVGAGVVMLAWPEAVLRLLGVEGL